MRLNDERRLRHRITQYHVDSMFPNRGPSGGSTPACPGVYYLFDDEGYLLKFGSTGNLSDRIPENFEEHGQNESEFRPVWAVYDCCRTKAVAEHFERLHVENYRCRTGFLPPLNAILPPQSDRLMRYIERYLR